MSLREIIIQRIEKEGPLSFRDFMDMCLYYPQLGYYQSAREKLGKHGDYFTGPTLSPAFGAMIGKQLEEMWRLLGENEFSVVEYGAGTGALCTDILSFLKKNARMYDGLKYFILEKSGSMREEARKHIKEPNVIWCDGWQDLPEINGCVLANEVVDNFPVHQVLMKDEMMELYVDYKNDFVESFIPADGVLRNYMEELKVKLPNGFRTEINLEANKWIQKITGNLKKGYVITIDYGFPSSELYQDYRRLGTLMCYNKHRVNDKPYLNIGEQDITSHVNFSALCLWGVKSGLEFAGFRDQAGFLYALGIKEYLSGLRKADGKNINDLMRYFTRQALLEDLGAKLKVLVLQKGAPRQQLMGFEC